MTVYIVGALAVGLLAGLAAGGLAGWAGGEHAERAHRATTVERVLIRAGMTATQARVAARRAGRVEGRDIRREAADLAGRRLSTVAPRTPVGGRRA